MYRKSYNGPSSFNTIQQSHYSNASSSGFGLRAPLYPIRPTETLPDFKPAHRGFSPSPYLGKQGIKPPSYENRYLQRAESFAGQTNISYEEREKRLIDRNQEQIQQEQRRREQIVTSYTREIQALRAKLNRNQQKKLKMHSEIEMLQNVQSQLNQKMVSLAPPQKNMNDFEPIDRKQQQMIILKNKLMSSMRQNETQLNQREQQQQTQWQNRVSEKQKVLFRSQQILRDRRLQLHVQKQRSLQKPDFLSIEDEVRETKYLQFVEDYKELQARVKSLSEQRQQTNKNIKDNIQLKKPQFHNINVRRQELKRDFTNLQLRVQQLARISQQMQAANKNLMNESSRKQQMITKYQSDIYQLKQKKQTVEFQINRLMNEARQRDSSTLSKSLSDIFAKLQQKLRQQQGKVGKLRNAYQKLYELLCSAVSKNIHQTLNDTINEKVVV